MTRWDVPTALRWVPVVHIFMSFFYLDLPQVLQKNMGVFSLRSQLAQVGYSSEEDSTRKRRSESVGGTEWPSLSWVTFLRQFCQHGTQLVFLLLPASG